MYDESVGEKRVKRGCELEVKVEITSFLVEGVENIG